MRVTCRQLKSEIEITVDDDGPGIRPDAMEKIFERFYTDRPHQGFGQNSGLGLSISKQIVDAHGGQLWAENRMSGDDDRRRALHAAAAGAVMASAPTIHASCVLVGADAVLIRGPSGSGKSRLALRLLQAADAAYCRLRGSSRMTARLSKPRMAACWRGLRRAVGPAGAAAYRHKIDARRAMSAVVGLVVDHGRARRPTAGSREAIDRNRRDYAASPGGPFA